MYTDLTALQVVAAGEAALLVSFVLGVVLHETGHAVAAWLAGLDVRLVSIGQGPAIVHAKCRGVGVVWHAWPFSGFVAIAVRPGMSRYRHAAMVAGGPGVNIVLLALFAVLDQVEPYYDAILMGAGVAQCLLVGLTLTPFKVKARGALRSSDGLQLWIQLVRRPPDAFTVQYAAVMRLLFAKDFPLPPPSSSAPDLVYQVVRLDRIFDAWGMQDAARSVRALLDAGQLTLAERALALDFLVSGEVLLGGTEVSEVELDAWSAEACILAPGATTTLTRVGVLATHGRAEQAMDMLLAMPEDDKSIGGIFRYRLHMAQAAAARGWEDTAKQSLDMARKAARSKVLQRRVMMRVLARAERTAPLSSAVPALGRSRTTA